MPHGLLKEELEIIERLASMELEMIVDEGEEGFDKEYHDRLCRIKRWAMISAGLDKGGSK